VNQTRLVWLRAVPTPVLALEVQRGAMPGQPGAMGSVNIGYLLTITRGNDFRRFL
jgi:hypothetical protein